MLSGVATLEVPGSRADLANIHCVTLPKEFKATLTTQQGASFLQLEIHDVGRLDGTSPPTMLLVDWTREKVFENRKDSRKRVPLVTPTLCTAFRADMVVFPARTMAPMSHREGAGTFFYVMGGRGTARSNAQRDILREGDFLYVADREPGSIEAAPDSEIRFVQLYVPGTFKTVWSDPRITSEWMETDRNIHGYRVGMVNPYATSRGGGMMF
jgi:hypothetical protein